MAMTLDEVDDYATSLAGCKRKGHPGRVAWYVDDRLVVRQDEPGTLLVRVDPGDREQLLEAHPTTFGVPPRWEAHRKVQAQLDGDAGAIREAIRLAWASQRR
ncbi:MULTISPECIES: hypothetical protein [unclassified Phycicoccus]|uniref:hypothetical protein n=1 Tax=unclassified Phycicoccus TaxID=2637926 RepID=UPI000A6A2802|nr:MULTISPECIES: hypothetical protein [unclassified Phycicoccus]